MGERGQNGGLWMSKVGFKVSFDVCETQGLSKNGALQGLAEQVFGGEAKNQPENPTLPHLGRQYIIFDPGILKIIP